MKPSQAAKILSFNFRSTAAVLSILANSIVLRIVKSFQKSIFRLESSF